MLYRTLPSSSEIIIQHKDLPTVERLFTAVFVAKTYVPTADAAATEHKLPAPSKKA